MKVYFSASRYYREEFLEVYDKVLKVLSKNECKVIDNTIKDFKSLPDWKTDREKEAHYKSMVKQMDSADFSVFEASFPSTLHIGHEITLAIEKGKPVIVLYRDDDGKEPMLFRGLKSDKIIWIKYNLENISMLLDKAIDEAKKVQDVRFNFFVSPKILNYLDWVAQKRMIPRSVFLRSLIEKEMKKDVLYRKTDN